MKSDVCSARSETNVKLDERGSMSVLLLLLLHCSRGPSVQLHDGDAQHEPDRDERSGWEKMQGFLLSSVSFFICVSFTFDLSALKPKWASGFEESMLQSHERLSIKMCFFFIIPRVFSLSLFFITILYANLTSVMFVIIALLCLYLSVHWCVHWLDPVSAPFCSWPLQQVQTAIVNPSQPFSPNIGFLHICAAALTYSLPATFPLLMTNEPYR